jgi:hypothetical protein
MLLISHRGNLYGPSSEENNPATIEHTLSKGFHAEIDLWVDRTQDSIKIMSGHDHAQYVVDLDWLTKRQNQLWIHAKSLSTLEWFLEDDRDWQLFWHQEDDFTITTTGHIWTYPNKQVGSSSIIVAQNLEDTTFYSEKSIYGLCSDFVGNI